MEEIRAIRWRGDRLELLDQRLLPHAETYVSLADYRDVIAAIRDMVVRGAPAIGVTAAYGLALAARELQNVQDRRGRFCDICEEFARARPTAVNLFWAIERLRLVADDSSDDEIVPRLEAEAKTIEHEDVEANRDIGSHGAKLIPDDARIITICNAGALATAGYGTSLGVIRTAHEAGKRPLVWVMETRPRLQGMKLTAWELTHLGIPFQIITDGMAGSLMRAGRVEAAIAGADRIAANGDTANKIGTYSLAVLAHAHGIPFYIAAPTSTIDPTVESGSMIPIEERCEEEVTEVNGVRLAPHGASAFNPSFDVTPAELISGIITERGVIGNPYRFTEQPS